jgi:hypothetical protein
MFHGMETKYMPKVDPSLYARSEERTPGQSKKGGWSQMRGRKLWLFPQGQHNKFIDFEKAKEIRVLRNF